MTLETALRNTCKITTPSPLIDEAFRYAKDNIARCMRYYTHGWGMSNAPHGWTLVVGRDTGWMTIGTDYVAPWFAPEALAPFRDRQMADGKILEYIDLETGEGADYGLNVSDNTPLYILGICHHMAQHPNEKFRSEFADSVARAADHLVSEVGPHGLIAVRPAGTGNEGVAGWRNCIQGYALGGETTEINCLAARALREAAEFRGESRYATVANRLVEAINERLWAGDGYLLSRDGDEPDTEVTVDMLFPILCGVAPPDRATLVLDRLAQPDFWTPRGMRTIPSTSKHYHPSDGYGLVGGVWPNPTLWYAAAAAPNDPDRALAAIETVARSVVEAQDESSRIAPGEFAEYFHGDSGVNLGMALSPWTAPTFIWCVMEGLLGASWRADEPSFNPSWPSGWETVAIDNMRHAGAARSVTLTRNGGSPE